ncbi:MAG TPA: MFS transporter [Ktedonobacteraceae bacterium]|nr:MFS transporter [Ktedonobacteraceae bacterium]
MSIRSSPVSESRTRNDFWKFWTGQTVSTLGSSFTGFALPLLIFQLTGSSLNLALTVVATVLPYLLFGLVIGAWVDRVNRKRVMVVTDLTRALVIASIPLAAAQGLLSVWWIYAVAFLNSTLTICFDAANFAAVPSLVRQEDFVTANGRLQAGYSIAKVGGSLLGGLLILVIPLPMLLLIDALSFLVSAGSLVLITTSFHTAPDGKQAPTSVRQNIVEGLRYVLKHPILSWITLLLLLVNFILPTANAQLVLFARHWFAASDTQVGLLYAGGSLGTVVCSLVAGRFRKRWTLGTLALGALMMEGVVTALTAVTHWYWVLLLLWALRGGADVLFTISTYSLAQTAVPKQLLGRVITVVRVLTWSTASLGALLGGFAIERIHQIGLVYAVIGLLICGITLPFFLTPLGQTERYLLQDESSQR